MGEVTDRVKRLEDYVDELNEELVAVRAALRSTVGGGKGKASSYAEAAAARIKAIEDEVRGLKLRLTTTSEQRDRLQTRLDERADTDNEEFDRLFKRLGNISKMLQDAFPGDIATIEGRVAAACANTKALAQAQRDLELEQINRLDAVRARDEYESAWASCRDSANSADEKVRSLASQLDRERRLHGECVEELLTAKKERDRIQDVADAQRRENGERATLLHRTQERAAKAARDRDTWKSMANDNGAALAVAEEKLRRARHETIRPDYSAIREAALNGEPFFLEGKQYVQAGSATEKLNNIRRLLEEFNSVVEL